MSVARSVAAQRLVNHHARVRQAETFAFGTRGQQEGAHRARPPIQMVLTSGLMNFMVS